MKIIETDEGWTVEHNGKSPIAIDGQHYFSAKSDLSVAVEKRGLFVWADGSIERTPENPVVPPAPEQDDDAFDAAAPAQTPVVDKPKPKAAPRKRAPKKKPEEKKTVGRPRTYTPEEAAERRREQAKKYTANRTEAQKEAARERARRWRERNPEKTKAARQKSTQDRIQRYKEDDEFRKQFNEYQRTYKRTKRVES